jgi:hypothetical protein
LLRLADDFETHVRQIAAAFDDPEGTRRQVDGFVKSFTRPFGLDVEATPRIVEEIERLGAAPAPAPRGLPLYAYPLRALLYPIAVLMALVRRTTRVSRKRSRQLRPVTATGTLVRMTLVVFDWLFRFRPIRNFAKQHIVPRAVSRLSAVDAPTEEAVAVPRVLQRIERKDRPIIVGPWVSEVGFELLYWIPFLNWVREHRPFSADRLVVVSRGGCASWYRDIATHYVELFDYYTPEEFRQRSEQRLTDGKAKPRTMSEFDRNTIKLVRQGAHLPQCDLLHPMYMYRLFHKFWQSRAPADIVENFAVFRPLPPLDTNELTGKLPDDYVAVRFYFNDVFPDTERNRTFVASVLNALAETTDVVLLNPAMRLDDRVDVPVTARGRIHDISDLMSPRTNLDIQSKVIARARAFVGTHGGLSYLAPLYGVKSLSFYSDPRPTTVRHLELARREFNRLHPGSYVALDVNDLDTLREAFGEHHEAVSGLARVRLF